MSIKKNLQFRILYKKRKRKINFPNSCKYQIVANISVTIILNLPKSTIPFRSLERVFHLVQHGCDSNTNQMTKSIRPCSIVSSNRKKKKGGKKNPIFSIAFIRHGVDYGRVARRWKLQLILVHVASLTTVMHNETDGEWNMKRHELFQIAKHRQIYVVVPLEGETT